MSWVIEKLKERKGLSEETKYRWLLGDFVTLMLAATYVISPSLPFVFSSLSEYPPSPPPALSLLIREQ